MQFTKDQIREARNTNLYRFLLDNHRDSFNVYNSCLKWKDNRSVTIGRDFNGYHDFANGEKGNSIEFLTRYLPYDFTSAVSALLGFATPVDHSLGGSVETKEIHLPAQDPFGNDGITNYLHKQRGIPEDTIQMLIDTGLIYQEEHGHLVFVNREKTMFQVRRTYFVSPAESKIVSSGKSKSNEFWYMSVGKGEKSIYVCEGAIDAISLYELNDRKSGYYISMGGVSNYGIIDRVTRNDNCEVILAVDNDEHGDICREKYPDLPHMIPRTKDWNEDLMVKHSLAG